MLKDANGDHQWSVTPKDFTDATKENKPEQYLLQHPNKGVQAPTLHLQAGRAHGLGWQVIWSCCRAHEPPKQQAPRAATLAIHSVKSQLATATHVGMCETILLLFSDFNTSIFPPLLCVLLPALLPSFKDSNGYCNTTETITL